MKTSVEKYSYQKHRSRANAEREVEEKFNRDWERVSTQMGKDLPRYYSTCEIVDHRTGAQYNGENDSLENFFLTLGNAFELSEVRLSVSIQGDLYFPSLTCRQGRRRLISLTRNSLLKKCWTCWITW